MKKYIIKYKTKWWVVPLQIFLIGMGNRIRESVIYAHDLKEMKRKFKFSDDCCIQPIGFCKLISWTEAPFDIEEIPFSRRHFYES